MVTTTKLGYTTQTQKRIEFTPQMFGARGNKSNDDTQAIENMVAEAAALNVSPHPNALVPTILFPYAEGYLTSGTVTIPENIHVLMDSNIWFTGDEDAECLIIGTTDISNRDVDMRIRVVRATVSDWFSEDSIGVKIVNADACKITVGSSGFTIGLQCMGSGTGFANNRIQLLRMFDHKYHIDCTNESSDGIGWCNDNIFMGGRIANIVGVKVGQARYGVRLTTKDGTNVNNNNNVFFKVSIELHNSASLPAESVPILCVHGTDNRSISCRNEGNGSVFAIEQNQSKDNDWGHTQTKGTIDYQGKTRAGSKVTYAASSVSNNANRLVFDSGPMNENAVMYDATQIHIPNCNIHTSSNGTKNFALNSITWFHSEDFTVDTGNDQLIDIGHLLQDGDEFYVTTSAADAPDGLAVATKHFVVNAITDRFEASLTLGGSAVNILDAGTGTHTYVSRARWIEMDQSRGVGVNINTTVVKQLVVEPDVETGFGGRVSIICYDAEGIQLTDNPSQRHVRGTFDFQWLSGSFGGSYRTDFDSNAETPLVVGDEVKSISLFMNGGSANIRIRRFKVWTTEQYVAPRTWLGYQVPEPGVPVATQAPTTGMYLGPLKIWDHTPVNSEPMGWMLPTGGAPGTWLNMPEYGAVA